MKTLDNQFDFSERTDAQKVGETLSQEQDGILRRIVALEEAFGTLYDTHSCAERPRDGVCPICEAYAALEGKEGE